MDNKNLTTQFDLHSRLFNNVLENIDDKSATTKPKSEVNHISWIAGHLLSTRHMLGNLLGVNETEKYASLFAGGKGSQENTQYPDLADIKKEWEKITAKIRQRFANVSANDMSLPTPQPIPVSDQTIGGMYSFLLSHEGYHLGQLGLLRKYFGQDAMSYN